MAEYSVCRRFSSDIRITPKVCSLMRMFGVTAERLRERSIAHKCRLEIREGDIVYISGPSGSGKSVLLRELEAQVDESQRINLNDIELPNKGAVIDYIEGDVTQALKLLS